MSIDYATIRRRTIMETILLSLATVFEANPDVQLTGWQIFSGMQASVVPPTDEEALAALAELIRRGLVEAADDGRPVKLVQGKSYRITMDGLDFKRHQYPWDLMDRFATKHNG